MTTHNDIYTKFLIEYDKDGEATSYPSLTEYEIATFLDKAYNALIAQKVTGNNYRRAGLESDLKSIADLGPLTKSIYVKVVPADDYDFATNVAKASIPKDMLYFLQALMKYVDDSKEPIDGNVTRSQLVKLVNHDIAQKFFTSTSNIPWIKQAVCFIEGDSIYVVYDPLNPPVTNDFEYTELSITDEFDTEGAEIKMYNVPGAMVSALNYILGNLQSKQVWYDDIVNVVGPEIAQSLIDNQAVRFGWSLTYSDDDMDWYKLRQVGKKTFRLTYIRKPNTFVKQLTEEGTSFFDDGGTNDPRYQFECNDTVAEELVSLAVSFALENVESQRLNSKLNMRGLEA